MASGYQIVVAKNRSSGVKEYDGGNEYEGHSD